MRIGFIGLGVMGAPMAANLIAAGHDLALHRVKDSSQFLVESGGVAYGSAEEVAAQSEVVIIMVPDTPDVAEVLFGDGGVASGLKPGSLVIDMSSISPLATKDFAARVGALGADYLDAPVSGGEPAARDGSLTIMVGGTESAFARAAEIFAVLGSTVTRIGEVSAGQSAKVANQIIVAGTIEAVAEGLSFARAAGVEPGVVRQALMGGFASSRILELHGQRMIDEAFEPGFRIRLHRKDLALALTAAQSLDLPLPVTATTAQLMNAAVAEGLGESDHSAMIKVLEPNQVRR